MTRILLAGLAAIPALIALPAVAGSLGPVVAAPAPMAPVAIVATPVAPSADWTGAYVGAELGFGTFDTDGIEQADRGTLYGITAGYQRDLGRVVLGAEVDYNWADNLAIGEGAPELDNLTRVTARVGYDAGRLLPYATAGYAAADIGGVSGTTDGYVYGIGADYALTQNVAIGAEFLQHEFDGVGDNGPDASLSTFGLHATYRF